MSILDRFCLAFALAAALLVAPAPAAPANPAGRYRLVGEPDTASEVILLPDGHFRYFLSAGALDEHAEGRWTADGANVRITTDPKPVPPAFVPGFAAKTAEAPLTLKVGWPDGRGIAGVDLRVGFDVGPPVLGHTQDYGWSLPREERRAPRWVEYAVPMHALASPRFPIDPAKANDLAFILIPNDLGLIDFHNVLLEGVRGGLVLHRSHVRLNYAKLSEGGSE